MLLTNEIVGIRRLSQNLLYTICVLGTCFSSKYITTNCQTKAIMEQSGNSASSFVKSNRSQKEANEQK